MSNRLSPYVLEHFVHRPAAMAKRELSTLDVRTRAAWRKWLAKHHQSESSVWLVFYKKDSGEPSIDYNDAVEEALCYGWVDSLVRRLDDARYARKFTPRKADSKWSTSNRKRYASLQQRGLLAEAGRQRAPTSRSGDAPRPSVENIPAYIKRHLQTNAKAWRFFQQLATTYRRHYIAWIDAAKRDATRQKRLREAVRRLAAGEKLGLK